MKNVITRLFPPVLSRHIAALLCIGLTTLILRPVEPYFEIQLITLVYLLPVILSTVVWGLTPGILSAFMAFLAFNYFFIQPYHTLQVHKTQDLITLIIFLIVSVVMSQLIGQARQGVRLARNREWEATRMYELISTLASLQDPQSISQALANHTLDTFHLQFVAVNIEKTGDNPGVSAFAPSNFDPPSIPPHIRMSLKTARGNEGALHIWQHHGQQLTQQESQML
ncbi:DUF4118 domain-containing protein, partial [bacterium]|nr:DUF4118 domain-containing protein [bacterium]